MTDLQFDAFTWLVTLAAIVGVVLNIKKKRLCFWIWAVTNASWCVIDLMKGIYAQSFLFFIYFLLAIWGIVEWGKKNEE